MIFGDPYKFAISIQLIDQWNQEYFCGNGVFGFCVDGDYIPREINTACLGSEIIDLKDSALVSFPENKKLFEGEKNKVFGELVTYIIQAGEDNPSGYDFPYPEYQASTTIIDDAGFAVFAITWKENVRILAASYSFLERTIEGSNEWIYIKKPHVKEVIISKDEIKKITSQTFEYYNKYVYSISNTN